MRTQFLLPCPVCQRKHAIDTSQAGDRLVCGCGKALDVPTLREIRRLEEVSASTAEKSKSSAAWGHRQGLMLLGAGIFVAGLIPAIYFGVTMPREPVLDVSAVTERLSSDLDQMPLTATWFYYQRLLAQGLVRVPTPNELQYETQYQAFLIRLTAALIASSVGLVILLGSWLLKKPASKGRAAMAPSQG